MTCFGFRTFVWPPPYDFAFDHLQKQLEDPFVDNEDAYYTTDLENEDGRLTFSRVLWHDFAINVGPTICAIHTICLYPLVQ